MTVYSDPLSCKDVADENGKWSCSLPADLPPGDHNVYIEATSSNNMTQSYGPFPVKVATTAGDSTESIVSDEQHNDVSWLVSVISLLAGLVVVALVIALIHNKRQRQ